MAIPAAVTTSPVARQRPLRFLRSAKVAAGALLLAVFGVAAAAGGWLAPYSANATNVRDWVRHVLVEGTGAGTSVPATYYPLPLSPSGSHWLGTTVFAQDVWAQLLTSTQATLLVGLLAAAIATCLSVGIGVTGGYLGGGADEGLSLTANVFLAIPGLPLLIVLADYVPQAGSSVVLVALIIALTGWAWGARVLRAQTLSLRSRDFVEAARVSGESRARIILAEVLPNLLPIVASSFLFTTIYAIYAYTAIAFLGLAGSPSSSPPGLWNWGEMLRQAFANNAIRSGWWWWWVPPGLCIALLGTALALLNFGIDEYVNPRLRSAGRGRSGALGLTPVMHRPAAAPAAPAADRLLEVRGLTVDYGTGPEAVRAVADCDLTVRRGQVLGLAGESGSGKTTLALAAIRLLRPPAVITSGQVMFNPAESESIDLLAAGPEELQAIRWSEIAVVLQSASNALNPVLSIGAQFDDMLRTHRPQMTRADRRVKSGELLELVGVSAQRLGGYPHELSGGMRQRAMIAMALALDPALMILDEPTTALDVVTQREVLEELVGLRDRFGFAALFVTHDLSLLVELADEIAVMYAGRVVERAPARDLFHSPRHPYTAGLLNCFPPLHGARGPMTGIPGSPASLRQLPAGCPFHPRCQWALDRCRQELPPLAPVGDRGREVACWLHRGEGAVPPELARPEVEGFRAQAEARR